MSSLPRITPADLLLHDDWVRRVAKRLILSPDEADDVAQQTMIDALRSPAPINYSVRPWLETIAMRVVIRTRKRVDKERAALSDPEARRVLTRHGPATDEVVAATEIRALVQSALNDLKPQYHEVMLLRYYQQLAPQEIALRLALSVAAVNTRLKRARKKLRCSLDRKHGGDRHAWYSAIIAWMGDDPEVMAAKALDGSPSAPLGRGTARFGVVAGAIAAATIAVTAWLQWRRPVAHEVPRMTTETVAVFAHSPVREPVAAIPSEPRAEDLPSNSNGGSSVQSSAGLIEADNLWVEQLRELVIKSLDRSVHGDDAPGVIEILEHLTRNCPKVDPRDIIERGEWRWACVKFLAQGLEVSFGHSTKTNQDRVTIALDTTVHRPFPFDARTTQFDVTLSTANGATVLDATVINGLIPDTWRIGVGKTVVLGCRFWLNQDLNLAYDMSRASVVGGSQEASALIEMPTRGRAHSAPANLASADLDKLAQAVRSYAPQ